MLLTHTTQIRVRYDECDPMGFLHHSRYLQYFEIGRTELLRASGGSYRDMETAGQFVVVAKIECRYRQPARYDEVISLTTTVSKVTRGKILHTYEMFREVDGSRLVIAQADVTLAVIDQTGKIQPVPQSLLDAYQSS